MVTLFVDKGEKFVCPVCGEESTELAEDYTIQTFEGEDSKVNELCDHCDSPFEATNLGLETKILFPYR